MSVHRADDKCETEQARLRIALITVLNNLSKTVKHLRQIQKLILSAHKITQVIEVKMCKCFIKLLSTFQRYSLLVPFIRIVVISSQCRARYSEPDEIFVVIKAVHYVVGDTAMTKIISQLRQGATVDCTGRLVKLIKCVLLHTSNQQE